LETNTAQTAIKAHIERMYTHGGRGCAGGGGAGGRGAEAEEGGGVE